jgi:hypothetical protein
MNTYEDIITTLKAAATAVNPAGFNFHATEFQASLEYNKLFPQIVIVEARDRPDRQLLVNTWEFVVAVIDQDNPASNADSNMTNDPNVVNQEDLLRRMWLLKEAFMQNLKTEQKILSLPETWRRSLRQWSSTASGWYGTLTIKTKLPC